MIKQCKKVGANWFFTINIFCLQSVSDHIVYSILQGMLKTYTDIMNCAPVSLPEIQLRKKRLIYSNDQCDQMFYKCIN